MAMAVDALHAANWQRGADKKAARPQPIPRPGIEAPKSTRTELSGPEIIRRLEAQAAQRAAELARLEHEAAVTAGGGEQ